MARLGVNIETIAALRLLGRREEPDPLAAVVFAEIGGADGIVCPFREEGRPVSERDVRLIKEVVKTHFNLQIFPGDALMAVALEVAPDMVTLVPGKKPGATPGGGLDVLGHEQVLAKVIQDLRDRDIVVSVLVEPIIQQIKSAAKLGVDYIELHLGRYAAVTDLTEKSDMLDVIGASAAAASKIGLGVAAARLYPQGEER